MKQISEISYKGNYWKYFYTWNVKPRLRDGKSIVLINNKIVNNTIFLLRFKTTNITFSCKKCYVTPSRMIRPVKVWFQKNWSQYEGMTRESKDKFYLKNAEDV